MEKKTQIFYSCLLSLAMAVYIVFEETYMKSDNKKAYEFNLTL